MLYFQAQTGVIRDTKPKVRSNFWTYEIPNGHKPTLDKISDRCPDVTAEDVAWLTRVDQGTGG